MAGRYRTALIAATIVLLLHTARIPAAPYIKTPLEESGTFTSFTRMEEFLNVLAREAPGRIRLQTIGRTQKKGMPVYLCIVSSHHDALLPSERLRVMILARAHGSEPSGMEAALSLIRDLALGARDAEYLENFDLLIIPCVNPEGTESAIRSYRQNDGFWGKNGRMNGQGLDINRDYLELRTAEARAVVQVFNAYKPHMVFDLHEFSTVPLVGSEEGWWKGNLWDVLIGAGRSLDADEGIRDFCRRMLEENIFPSLSASGIRGFFYVLNDGDLGSTHFGANAADYFLLRNVLAFLVETPVGGGERTLSRRRDTHLLCLNLILRRIGADSDLIRRLLRQASENQKEKAAVTLKVKPIEKKVAVDNLLSSEHDFEAKVNFEERTYRLRKHVRFRGLDYFPEEKIALPFAYILQTKSYEGPFRLLLHGVELYEALEPFQAGKMPFSAHTIIIPSRQGVAPLLGLLFSKDARRMNIHSPSWEGILDECAEAFPLPRAKRLHTPKDVEEAVRRYEDEMERVLRGENGKRR